MNECDFAITGAKPSLSLTDLAYTIHEANVVKGFWNTEDAILDNKLLTGDEKTSLLKAFTAQRIALMHSELSEALEADRKDLMDDKLPQYKGLDVELVDTLIRILDYCGRHCVAVDEILEAKLAYNAERPYLHGKKY